MKFIHSVCLFFLITSCHFLPSKEEDKVVATVFDAELMYSEVAGIIPPRTGKDDSILMSRNYVRNWITKQLLLYKAIENLSDEEKDIQKQVEDYQTTVLIYRYKQKLITQKLSEEVENEEIEKYYEENKVNFVLSTPIVKAVFFILPKTAPHLVQMRKWFKSEKQEDQDLLDDYCITHAKKYDDFHNNWIEMKFLFNLVPGDVTKLENELRQNQKIIKEDDENYYFLKITEVYKEQNVAPLDYVRDEITLILKNKKKIEFESELEKQINEEAVRKKHVKIY